MLILLFLAAVSPLEGSWTNPSRNVTVRIGPCGATLCGRVSAASASARQEAAGAGTPKLIGTRLMSDIEQVGPSNWRADVFVPDRNLHAIGELNLVGPRILAVSGCALGGLLCKTQNWTRVTAPARKGASELSRKSGRR